jgi:hypothetical protein
MSGPAGPDGRPDPARAEVAGMAAVIERAEADLSLVEEPARFAAVLDAGAPDERARRSSAPRSTTR